MRPLALVLPASLLWIVNLQGQGLTEHAAAAAGATIGTGAGKSLSDSMTKIFGGTDKETSKAAKADTKKQEKPAADRPTDPAAAKSKPAPITAHADAGPAPFEPSGPHAPSQPRRAPRKPVLTDETAKVLNPDTAVTPAPPVPAIVVPVVKVPTVEDVANIKVGMMDSEMVAALGQPSSRLVIPDDDGHLRETCQFWANGHILGTIRLDNGQVASVETRPEN